jgi:NCAIR mutase (PurE)-related protein
MNEERLRKLLTDLQGGSVTIEQVVRHITDGVGENLGFAMVDHHRELRQGFPEVILCEGKTPGQSASIARRIVRQGGVLLATRAGREHFRAVKRGVRNARYNPVARTITAGEDRVTNRGKGTILIVTAGTSDIPVAEEAAVTAGMMGNSVERLVDVGVAGIHRILGRSSVLRNASVIIVVAGMEGALASVVGGLVQAPVIAVPTSIGYGASFGGIAALLGMLNSCAAGVTVVNIDNGFGAACIASLINRL